MGERKECGSGSESDRQRGRPDPSETANWRAHLDLPVVPLFRYALIDRLSEEGGIDQELTFICAKMFCQTFSNYNSQ
jgi:hypothetical protein